MQAKGTTDPKRSLKNNITPDSEYLIFPIRLVVMRRPSRARVAGEWDGYCMFI